MMENRYYCAIPRNVWDYVRRGGRFTLSVDEISTDDFRVGVFRLGCRVDHEQTRLAVYEIEKRPGAYRPGDD